MLHKTKRKKNSHLNTISADDNDRRDRISDQKIIIIDDNNNNDDDIFFSKINRFDRLIKEWSNQQCKSILSIVIEQKKHSNQHRKYVRNENIFKSIIIIHFISKKQNQNPKRRINKSIIVCVCQRTVNGHHHHSSFTIHQNDDHHQDIFSSSFKNDDNI